MRLAVTTMGIMLTMLAASASDDLSLPAPLTTWAGDRITTSAQWQKTRRPEILELFRTHVYGRTPVSQLNISSTVFDLETNALNGKAIRKQVAIEATSGQKRLRMNLLLYLPKSANEQAVPVMLLLNFGGNHTIHSDPAIAIPQGYLREKYRPAEDFRGKKAPRYPIEELLARGYGIATANYGDLDPDFHDGFENGIHPLFNTPDQRSGDAWGAVGAWAWGLSRFMDYFETDSDVDHSRVAVLGHSRLGKAALWAGAQDERFAMVISNNSGCTGAALSRRQQGERVAQVNKSFPHWFCENYKQYNDKESTLPVDQHMLIALMAPRPVYVASADRDLWADPEGEFLSCVYAAPVYKLFGLDGMQTEKMPVANQPINDGHIGYHLRHGEHDLTRYDWICYMDFADKHWKTSQPKHGKTRSE